MRKTIYASIPSWINKETLLKAIREYNLKGPNISTINSCRTISLEDASHLVECIHEDFMRDEKGGTITFDCDIQILETPQGKILKEMLISEPTFSISMYGHKDGDGTIYVNEIIGVHISS